MAANDTAACGILAMAPAMMDMENNTESGNDTEPASDTTRKLFDMPQEDMPQEDMVRGFCGTAGSD
jgi:hypothetical protein